MNVYCILCQKEFNADNAAAPCPNCDMRMGGLEDVRTALPPYESRAAREVLEWLNRPPGMMTTAINKVIDGIVGGVKTIVPDKVATEISGTLAEVLEFLQELSFYTWMVDKDELRKEIESRFGEGKLAETLTEVIFVVSGGSVFEQAVDLGFDVKTLDDLRALDLEKTDALVGEYMTLIGNRGLAVAEGAVTGVGGLPLLLLDIPAIAAINFRYVQQIASCFGYNQDLEQEKIFAMRTFMLSFGGELGGCDADRETGTTGKIGVAYELRSLAYALKQNWSYEQMAEKTVLMAILSYLKKSAPQQLARYLISRKVAASVPVLGAGISATINYALTSYTGKVAWYCYRYRKLLETFGGLDGDEMPLLPQPEK